MKSTIKGLLLLIVLLFLTVGLHSFIPAAFQIEKLTIGILLGLSISLIFGLKSDYKPGVKFALKHFLNVGIILLGLKLNYVSLVELGPLLLMTVAIYVPIVLLLSVILGKILGVPVRLSTLIGVGSSICGASASAAMAPLIGADEEETLISVAVISLLGAAGVVVFSGLAKVVYLSDAQYGLWSGLSLQGVGHALAAAFARGEEAGQMGTIIKMARVLMLVPMSLILPFIYRKKNTKQKVKFPNYVLFFLLAGLIGTSNVLPTSVVALFNQLSSLLILLAMIAMGLLVDLKSIKKNGIKPILLGISLFSLIAFSNYFIVQWFPLI